MHEPTLEVVSAGRSRHVRAYVRRLLLVSSGVLALLGTARPAAAIRPFVTDDARVVGAKLGQVETWGVLDRIQLDQNIFAAIGPTDWLEVTLGVVHGAAHRRGNDRRWGLSGPILQAKALAIEAQPNGHPGLAICAGILPPWGTASQKPAGTGLFTYLALTESLWEERLLIHANVGYAGTEQATERQWKRSLTAGLGTQFRIYGPAHGVAEIYYADPYDPVAVTSAAQIGFRFIWQEWFQNDVTLGGSLADPPRGERTQAEAARWITFGIRVVSPELW
jgi:hypothetical protein